MSDEAFIKGKVCSDYLYKYVAIPPKLSVSKFMTYVKGKIAFILFDRHPEFRIKKATETSGREGIVLQRWEA